MVNWIIVLGIAVIIVAVGSMGRIPFTDLRLAVSDETQAQAVIANTPTYSRQEAISLVKADIRSNCTAADKYLQHADRFEAKWMRQPWTDDHNVRESKEWTVTDPVTGAYWRLYEETLEIVPIIGDCRR